MKLIIIFLLAFIVSTSISAQNMVAIEKDLLTTFNKISSDAISSDPMSLDKLNDVFGTKLQSYIKSYPILINEDFKALKKQHLNILTSSDKLFRIYSWDTWTGGTMHDFANVLQFKIGAKINSMFLRSNEDIAQPLYTKLYTFDNAGKCYYLAVYSTISSSKDAGQGIQMFSIEGQKLSDDPRIIKTASGLRSKIYYNYDFFSVVDIAFEKRPSITFDAISKIIKIPLVTAKGKVTSNFITYKFTGQYFEKVKS